MSSQDASGPTGIPPIRHTVMQIGERFDFIHGPTPGQHAPEQVHKEIGARQKVLERELLGIRGGPEVVGRPGPRMRNRTPFSASGAGGIHERVRVYVVSRLPGVPTNVARRSSSI